MLKATAVAIVLLTCAAACEPRALASESPKFSSSPSLGLRDTIHIAASTKPAKPAGEEPETSRRGELPPVKSSGTAQKFAGALEVVVSLGAISGIVLAAIASAAALFYGRRNRGRQDEPSPVSSSPGNASKSESSESDTVEVSAFAPAIGKAEEEVLVQLFFSQA